MNGALRIVQRNGLVYRRVWRGSLFMNFLQPALYLLSMGVGVGSLVGRGDATFPGGVSYLAFLAPGLLAAACMQTATFESSFPIMGKMTWRRNYEAICATPLRPGDIVIGELLWITLRLTMVATAFGLVLLTFGIVRRPLAALALPAAVLTGLSFAAPLIAFTATLKNTQGNAFNVVFRFIVTPLFLFSGVFFPVSNLPSWLQMVALATPLYHGATLTRGLVLGSIDSMSALGHTAFLIAMTATGVAVAFVTFARRLTA